MSQIMRESPPTRHWLEILYHYLILPRHIANGSLPANKVDWTTLAFGNYSTSEQNTGFTWVDGKTIYKKTINFGALPNAASKTVLHGLSIDNIIYLTGISRVPGGVVVPIPFVSSSLTSQIPVTADNTNVSVQTGIDRTAFTYTYITIWYTKP